jgi:Response regulator containing CheY-like receiver, AAA-type ATPase, and DNA-binding domains
MKKTVLVIDPDREHLLEITRSWQSQPWRTITVPTLEEAIDVLSDTGVDMIIAAEELNWLNGSEFLRLTHHRYPQMIRVLITEEPDLIWNWSEPLCFHAESRIHFATSLPCTSECVVNAIYDLFGLEPVTMVR